MLTQKEEELVYCQIMKKHAIGPKKETLEEFDNRQPEDVESEAFHARIFTQEVLKDLKLSRLDSFMFQLLINGRNSCFYWSGRHRLTLTEQIGSIRL